MDRHRIAAKRAAAHRNSLSNPRMLHRFDHTAIGNIEPFGRMRPDYWWRPHFGGPALAFDGANVFANADLPRCANGNEMVRSGPPYVLQRPTFAIVVLDVLVGLRTVGRHQVRRIPLEFGSRVVGDVAQQQRLVQRA